MIQHRPNGQFAKGHTPHNKGVPMKEWMDGRKMKRVLRIGLKNCNRGGHKISVYTLVNFDSTFEQDLERIYTLRELGYWAYVTIYDKAHCDRKYKALARWANNRFIFAK